MALLWIVLGFLLRATAIGLAIGIGIFLLTAYGNLQAERQSIDRDNCDSGSVHRTLP